MIRSWGKRDIRLYSCPVLRDQRVGNIPPVEVRFTDAIKPFTRATWGRSVVYCMVGKAHDTFSQYSFFFEACAIAVYSSWKLAISARTPESGPSVAPLTCKALEEITGVAQGRLTRSG